MRNTFVICGLILSGCVIVAWAGSAEGAGRNFVLEQHLIEVEDIEAQGIRLVKSETMSQPPPGELVTLGEDQELLVGSLTLTVDPSGGLLGNDTWNFQPEVGFRLVSSPRIPVVEGQEGTLRSGLVSHLQYMVRKTNGDFRLETADPDPRAGMAINVIVRSLDEPEISDNQVDLDCSIKTTFLVGRVKYPDVDLEIGKPVFETRESQTRLRVPLNQWLLLQSIAAKDGPNGDTTLLIVMMRILEESP